MRLWQRLPRGLENEVSYMDSEHHETQCSGCLHHWAYRA